MFTPGHVKRYFFYQFTEFDQKCVDAAANSGNQTLADECDKERTKCKQNLACNSLLYLVASCNSVSYLELNMKSMTLLCRPGGKKRMYILS